MKQKDADVSKAQDIVSATATKTVAETKPDARLKAKRKPPQSILPAKEVVLVENEQTESTKNRANLTIKFHLASMQIA